MTAVILRADTLHRGDVKAAQLVEKINEHHRQAIKAGREALGHIKEVGLMLLDMKKLCHHGAFEPWIEEHCEFEVRTAQKYMRFAANYDAIMEENGPGVATITTLEEGLRKISAPPKVRKAPSTALLDEPVIIDGPCPHGGPHEYDDEACVHCHDPRPEFLSQEELDRDSETANLRAKQKEVSDLFIRADNLYGVLTGMLDQINKLAPNMSKADAQESLSLSYLDFKSWRKKALSE